MYRRILIALLALGLWAGQVRASAELILVATKPSVQPGDSLRIEISLNNSEPVIALQFDLDLPPALAYLSGSAALSERATRHHLEAEAVSASRVRVIVYSDDLSPISGTSGVLLSLDFTVLPQTGSQLLMASDLLVLDEASQPIFANVTGTSFTVIAPQIQVLQNRIDFGRVRLSQGKSATATLTNNGNANLEIQSLSTTDSAFTVDALPSNTLAPGEQVEVSLHFSPTKRGQYAANLLITSNDPNHPILRLPMKAEAFAWNALFLSPRPLANQDTVAVEIALENEDPVVAIELGLETGKDFEYVPGSAALLGRTVDHVLQADTSRGRVRFVCYSPTNTSFTGNNGKVFSFKIKLVGQPGSFYLIPKQAILSTADGENVLSDIYPGSIQRKAPLLQVESRSLDFGRVAVGDTAVRELALTNQGNDTLRISAVQSNRMEFGVKQKTPLAIPPGERRLLQFYFAPNGAGPVVAVLQIQSNDAASPELRIDAQGMGTYENILRIVDATAPPQQTAWVAVDLRNQSEIVALQFDLVLPEGFAVITDSIRFTPRRIDHTYTVQQLGNGRYRFLVYSPGLQPFAADSGAVLLIPVQVSSQTGRYNLRVEQAILSDPTGQNVLSEVMAGTLQVRLASTTMTFSYDSGWNLVSVPLRTASGSLTSLFPEAQGQALFFNQGYVPTSELQPGRGYWIQFPSPAEPSLQGEPLQQNMISLQPGWNLIGSIAESVPVAEVIGDPLEQLQALVFGYDGGYQPVDTLEAGKGYWVYAPVERELNLMASATGGTASSGTDGSGFSLEALAQELMGRLNSLYFIDAAGHEMVLLFGVQDSLARDLDGFRLPPAPPEGAFDVRFETGRFIETVPADLSAPVEHILSLAASHFPVKIKWNVRDDGVDYSLRDAGGGSGLTETQLAGSDSFLVRDASATRFVLQAKPSRISAVESDMAVPRTIRLDQNHPNPFSRETSVRFVLARQVHVRLTVYDINGRLVRRLLDREVAAGEHRVRIILDDLPAGVYFLELAAPGIRKTRKLVRMH